MQVGANSLDVLHLLLVLEAAQRLFDIFLDSLGKYLVGRGDRVGRLKDLVPWPLEDARRESVWRLGECDIKMDRRTQVRTQYSAP